MNCLLHIPCISNSHHHGVMDHKHPNRTDGYLVTRHRNNGGCRSCQSIDFDSDFSLVITEHVINLSRRKHVPARRVNPYGYIPTSAFQFFPKHLWCGFISPPCFIRDFSRQKKRPRFLGYAFISDPVPKLSFHDFPRFLLFVFSS